MASPRLTDPSIVPRKGYRHDSQRDVDQGADNRVPTWREKQQAVKVCSISFTFSNVKKERRLDAHYLQKNSRRSKRHFERRRRSSQEKERAQALIDLITSGEEENPYDTLDLEHFGSGWPLDVESELRPDPANHNKRIWGTLFYYENEELLHACPISEEKFHVLGTAGIDNPHQTHLGGIRNSNRTEEVGQLLASFGEGLRFVVDSKEGDVFMASFSGQVLEERSPLLLTLYLRPYELRGSRVSWTCGSPMLNQRKLGEASASLKDSKQESLTPILFAQNLTTVSRMGLVRLGFTVSPH